MFTNSTLRKHGSKFIVAILFLVVILTLFCMCLFGIKSLSQESISEYFSSEIYAKENIIEIYGGSQFLFGKKCIDKYSIVKNSYGKMTKPYEEITRDIAAVNVEKIVPICQYCNKMGIPYFYLTSLLPIVDEEDLPYSGMDYSHKNAILLQNILKEKGISLIDLRAGNITVSKNQLFYKTDHHWTTDTTFAAFQVVIYHIKDYINTDESWIDPANYIVQNYTNSFLGSYGIKVGKYYAGKDDFKVLIPKDDGEYYFEAYSSKGTKTLEKKGTWFEANMDQTILDDPLYNNKYNSWANDKSIENRMLNQNVSNDTKVLLISHSYGRPLAQYLSLCFREVRQLDPQKGRFSDNYLDYIDEYQPDIVLFLVEFEGDLIGEYNTER